MRCPRTIHGSLVAVLAVLLIGGCSDDGTTPKDPPLPEGAFSGTLEVTLTRGEASKSSQQFSVEVAADHGVLVSEGSMGYYETYTREDLCEVEDRVDGLLAPQAEMRIENHQVVIALELSGQAEGTVTVTCPGGGTSEVWSSGPFTGATSLSWEEAVGDGAAGTIVSDYPFPPLQAGTTYDLLLSLSPSSGSD